MAEDDPPVPVLIGGVDEALGLCCSGSQRLESAEVREWHKSLTWRGHSLRRKRASLTAEVRFSSKRLGPLRGREKDFLHFNLSTATVSFMFGGPLATDKTDDTHTTRQASHERRERRGTLYVKYESNRRELITYFLYKRSARRTQE